MQVAKEGVFSGWSNFLWLKSGCTKLTVVAIELENSKINKINEEDGQRFVPGELYQCRDNIANQVQRRIFWLENGQLCNSLIY